VSTGVSNDCTSSSALMMEAELSSETSVNIYNATRRNVAVRSNIPYVILSRLPVTSQFPNNICLLLPCCWCCDNGRSCPGCFFPHPFLFKQSCCVTRAIDTASLNDLELYFRTTVVGCEGRPCKLSSGISVVLEVTRSLSLGLCPEPVKFTSHL
jgi:hypothetical protein